MLSHALEKAFSLPNPKNSFGYSKAKILFNSINNFILKYKWDNCLNNPISILLEYINYHQIHNSVSPDIIDLNDKLDNLLNESLHKKDEFATGGTYEVTREELIANGISNFKTLSANRYAIRNFSEVPVKKELILKALDIAKKSPSACNRQAYRVHIFVGEKKIKS